jgi:D-serine deaminase-like pyridoxal phosphate-dependent protein
MKIIRPTLIVDEAVCRTNIQRIVTKAKNSQVSLRPHFKTHQSHTIAQWYAEAGARQCTVSSVAMASYFAAHGWTDITIAFPINLREVKAIRELSETINLHVILESVETVYELDKSLNHPVGCYIEIDTGYHRTGIQANDRSTIEAMLQAMEKSSMLLFKGFLSHAGHSYKCRTKEEVQEIHLQDVKCMEALKNSYLSRYPSISVSIGDTPSCSIVPVFPGIDEIRPGNLVFYDLTQVAIGSCSREQIALLMACPVVARYPERNEAIIHGGSVHFSKDMLLVEGRSTYGEVIHFKGETWNPTPTGMYLKSLSQEHGIIHVPNEQVHSITVGDILGILPVHACLTADAMGEYVSLSGAVISMMPKRYLK